MFGEEETEAATKVVLQKGVLKISQKSHENTSAGVSFLIELQAWSRVNL